MVRRSMLRAAGRTPARGARRKARLPTTPQTSPRPAASRRPPAPRPSSARTTRTRATTSRATVAAAVATSATATATATFGGKTYTNTYTEEKEATYVYYPAAEPYIDDNGAYILYSIGNWSFGGNTTPKDMDTAIFQVTIRRDVDGSISNDSCSIIPCCVSSRPVLEGFFEYGYNDYCPTPYTEGSKAYLRALSKLEGTYKPDKEGRDYSDVYASYG